MAAIVTCIYCKQKFDREKISYIQEPHGSRFRYGHGDCYIKAKADGTEKNDYEIYDPAIFKNCFWCSKAINPKAENVIELPGMFGRYSHKSCAQTHPENDREKFIVYLIKLYKCDERDEIWQSFLRRAETMIKDYKFTYSGMMKALEYFHVVNKNPVDRRRGIGIIPYVYSQAYQYYYNLWIAQQENEKRNFKVSESEEIEINISPPKRQPKRRPLFKFLEEDIINGE